MSRHISYVEAIRKAANSNWGREYKSMADAEKDVLASTTASDIASLDFIRRLNVMIDALVNDGRTHVSEKDLEKPEEAKAFPGIKVGDFLYSAYELLDNGIEKHVVVAVTDDGFARICRTELENYSWIRVQWADGHHYLTQQEAVTSGADYDRTYHTVRADFMSKAIAAAASGGDLEDFACGLQENE